MEHRHHERKAMLLYLDVLDRERNHLLGHLGDISDEGLMLLNRQALPLYQHIPARIKLPKDEGFEQDFIDVEIETRWSAPDANPEFQCTGCRFLNLSADNLVLVKQVEALLSFS